jgi:hypothetical protein
MLGACYFGMAQNGGNSFAYLHHKKRKFVFLHFDFRAMNEKLNYRHL